MRFCLFTLLSILIFTSCRSPEADFKESFEDHSLLTFAEEIELKLDSLTAYSTTRVQFVEDCGLNDEGCISILNTNTGDIYLYNFADGKLTQKIHLQNSFGFEGISGYTINTDTIYAIHAKSAALGIYSSEGELLNYFSLKEAIGLFPLEGFIGSTISPIIVNSESVSFTRFFLPGDVPGDKVHMTANLNKKSGKIDYVKFFPGEYITNDYGPNMSVCYSNSFRTGKIIYGFPVCEDVFIAELETGVVETQKIKAWDISDTPPIKSRELQSFEKRDRYYRQHPNYSAVYYDHFRDRIYRFVNFPIDSETLQSPDSYKSARKTNGIMSLDLRSGQLSSYLLPPYTFTETMSFVTPSGFYIANRKLSGNDEDKLVFSKLTFPQ